MARTLPILVFAGFLACSAVARAQPFSREQILAAEQLPPLVALPTPAPDAVIALPDDWSSDPSGVALRLSEAPNGQLLVRRVSRNDGRLYLQIYKPEAELAGTADVRCGAHDLGQKQIAGSMWLSLTPKIGTLKIRVASPDSKELELTAPTTLVEVRGRQIFLNGEPFLLKGATGQVRDQAEADFVHGLGLNTLRGLGAFSSCEQFGFMSIASLNFGEGASVKNIAASDDEFQENLPKCIEWLKEHDAAPMASPNTLILQLGNERTGPGADGPGAKPLTRARRHVAQLLATARNYIKPLAPMLPIGYASEDHAFLAPDCMDVYMHNSFLSKDRYNYPWEDFLRWQGCLPPDGPTKEGRPFVNSEFGANRYLCQAYHGGPNNPFLERIHAWNFPCRWAKFMEHATVGGSIYCLHDLQKPVDQGSSCFGILTYDDKPKLACWEVAHMWRDFEVDVRDSQFVISYKRDYWARDCRLTVTPVDGKAVNISVADFAPHAKQTVPLPQAMKGAQGFRWRFNFTTHSGLIAGAAGAYPKKLEEADFLDSLKTRDTYPFLKELFDTEVMTADAKPAPPTLAEMQRGDGIVPVALHKPNGVTYLLLIARENPDKGTLREGVSVDIAFHGKVEKVDDMTGLPLPGNVDTTATASGLHLTNIEAPRIPGAIGQRSKEPFKLPIYRITP